MRTAWLVVASTLFLTRPAPAETPDTVRAAILRDTSPVIDLQHVDQLTAGLDQAGIAVEALSFDALSDKDAFSAERFDCLILPHAAHFPAAAGGGLTRFLKAGGDVVTLGGYAFREWLWEVDGTWLPLELAEKQQADPMAEETPLFAFDDDAPAVWARHTSNEDQASRVSAEQGRKRQCLRIDIKGLDSGWDTFKAPLTPPWPEGCNAVSFWAKASAGTTDMAVEIVEQDGARWITVVPLTKDWKRHMLKATDFPFWADGSPLKRGNNGDALNLAKSTHLSFGLAFGISSQPPGDHTIWIEDVSAVQAANGAEFDLAARFEFGLAFSDYKPYILRNCVKASSYPDAPVTLPRFTYEGPLDGYSAIGFEMPNQSAFLPLVEALDEHGRNRGWAVGMLSHYAGELAGSNWLLCGIESRDFYRGDAFPAFLAAALREMKGTRLAEAASARNKEMKTKPIRLTTAPPAGHLRLSEDGKLILKPDGTPLFMTGANYLGSYDRKCYMNGAAYDATRLEDDFRKCRDAGINALRFWLFGMQNDPAKVEAIRELARRYGVYLLLHIGADKQTLEESTAEARAAAKAFGDEPMVLGYDITNEPYVGTVGSITVDGKPQPLITARLHDKLTDPKDKVWVDGRVGQRSDWPRVPGWVGEDDLPHVYAAYALWENLAGEFGARGPSYSTFPGVSGPLRVPDEHRPVFDAVDASFRIWIEGQIAAIREADPHHFITVGYNTLLECIPANEQLDFVSHHVYQRPTSCENVVRNIDTLDRLATVWPERPISLGEFGYSNGLRTREGFLDFQASALGEMYHYLYALAHGHCGCMKWQLTDWPFPVLKRTAPWISGLEKQIYESRFGFYWYDGTLEGRPKPIAHALRFLADYIAAGNTGGTVEAFTRENAVHTGFVYTAGNALFIGDSAYDAKGLRFQTDGPAVVMLWWDADALRIMSTRDVEVSLKPDAFLPGLQPRNAAVGGTHAGDRRKWGRLLVSLLEGERVRVAW